MLARESLKFYEVITCFSSFHVLVGLAIISAARKSNGRQRFSYSSVVGSFYIKDAFKFKSFSEQPGMSL